MVLIDGDDWSSVNWQGILISDWSQTCDNWNLRPQIQKQSLKARLNQHRRPSSSEYQADSAIFEHSKTSGHQIDTEDVIILDREERWFERGVREAIWERVEKPSLNKRGASDSSCHTFGTNH